MTLTAIQEAAIEYLERSRAHQHRIRRCAARMVGDYCRKHGYDQNATSAAVKDMWDMYELRANSEESA